MSGVLVLGELADGQLRPVTFELIGAARALCEQGAGSLAVALIGEDVEPHRDELKVTGVEEVVIVPSPLQRFEAHVSQAVLEGLIEARRPATVIAGHTIDSLGFVAAVAARGRYGFASDVIDIRWDERGLLARRRVFGERLVAEVDFPGKDTVLLTLRPGAFAGSPATEPNPTRMTVSRLELDLDGRERTERVELRHAPTSEVDITTADFLLSIGRGVGEAAHVPPLQHLAERMGATLSVTGPVVEAGWASPTRKVGQSGRTVAPRVYLALGISGAPQHLAGMSRSRTIIAVNTDPNARIFEVAHYGAVADLFEVTAELERQLG